MVGRHGHDDRLAFAVLAQKIDADLEVRALHFAIDRLADVVQERRAHRDVRVEADFPRHDAGEAGDFRRMVQHVLPVAGAEFQPAHEPQDLRMEIVEPELERHRGAFLAHRLVGFVLDLLHDLFDARRVDASIGDEALDGLLGDLAPVRIEAGQDDGAGRVVDDQVDAGRQLERADVASLAADDAALQIVAGQIDDRHGRLDRVLRRAALDRFGDVVLGAVGGRFARFRVEPLQQVRGVVPRVAFDLLQQQLLGFLGRQARHALELVLLLRHELLVFGRRGRRCPFALGQVPVARAQLLLQPLDNDLTIGQGHVAPRQRLLERRRGLPDLARLPLGLDQQLVRLLFGFEERFLFAGFGVALGVFERPQRLFFGAADRFRRDALAVRHPDHKDQPSRDQRDDQAQQQTVYRQHA